MLLHFTELSPGIPRYHNQDYEKHALTELKD